MDDIGKVFADRFRTWDIRLPPGATASKKPGKIRKAGWSISYVFGDDCLEYYADHRMTSPYHGRIHSDGRSEILNSYLTFCPVGEEEDFYAHNRRVSAILKAKGLID